jgi:hypothetical protein
MMVLCRCTDYPVPDRGAAGLTSGHRAPVDRSVQPGGVSARPRLGGPQLNRRIAALVARPGPRTLTRIWQYLGLTDISSRALYQQLRRAAQADARGYPDHDDVVGGLVARLLQLPRSGGMATRSRRLRG